MAETRIIKAIVDAEGNEYSLGGDGVTPEELEAGLAKKLDKADYEADKPMRAKAWARFVSSATSMNILSSFGVTSIVRLSVGVYRIYTVKDASIGVGSPAGDSNINVFVQQETARQFVVRTHDLAGGRLGDNYTASVVMF